MSAASCQTYGEETNYRCLSCTKPTCNRSSSSSIDAPEETTGWRAGSFASFCFSCRRSAATGKEQLPRGIIEAEITKKDSHRNTTACSHLEKKRKCLDLSQKVAVLEFAKTHPKLGNRKIANHFGTGKTQIQAILRSKESITALYVGTSVEAKLREGALLIYSDVNEAVWDWYTLCGQSNKPVSGAMLQEEAMIIAERLGIDDFVASNGWLDRFKRQHNICNMTIAGEAVDVRTETIESWNERAREITRGWKAENITGITQEVFGVGSQRRLLTKREGAALEVTNKLSKGLPGHFS